MNSLTKPSKTTFVPNLASNIASKSGHLTLFSSAKINLFLHITGKRLDGYHNIQTVFRLLDWGDSIDFKITDQHFNPNQPIHSHNLPVKLSCNVSLTQVISDNLVVQAALKLIQNSHVTALTLPVIEITLNKIIPTGAGLGGGSSNAAATLIGLNKLWQLGHDQAALLAIAAQIGADVPIFIVGTDSIAEGIGEQLSPIALPSHSYLLLTPDIHISTAKLFAHAKLRRDMAKLNVAFIKAHCADYTYQQSASFCNIFEPVVTSLAPPVQEALTYLRQLERITESTARMTGSGSSVFLPYMPQHLSALQSLVANAPCPALFVNSLAPKAPL